MRISLEESDFIENNFENEGLDEVWAMFKSASMTNNFIIYTQFIYRV